MHLVAAVDVDHINGRRVSYPLNFFYLVLRCQRSMLKPLYPLVEPCLEFYVRTSLCKYQSELQPH